MKSVVFLSLAVIVLFSSCSYSRKLQRRAERHKEEQETTVTNDANKKYTPESYIAKWKSTAVKQMHQYGIPASITLAQALLESANGNSQLAREANNHFGIKCTSDWKGKTYHKNGDQNNDCFRKYSYAAESFNDHSKFLQKKRYADLFNYSSTDYSNWAKGLKKAGYATNPKYPELLTNLIHKYHLDQYDKERR